MPENLRPFHLAFPVIDLVKTKKWYIDILGCRISMFLEFYMFWTYSFLELLILDLSVLC